MQDVAFQLERLITGLYVYNRKCHKLLKPAAVFPIEVHLSIDKGANTDSSTAPPIMGAGLGEGIGAGPGIGEDEVASQVPGGSETETETEDLLKDFDEELALAETQAADDN